MLREKHWGTFVLCRAFSPAQEMQLSISRVRPEMNNNKYHILSIHLYKNFLIILQSSMSSHCYCVCVCVCVCVWGAGSRHLCLSVLCIAWETGGWLSPGSCRLCTGRGLRLPHGVHSRIRSVLWFLCLGKWQHRLHDFGSGELWQPHGGSVLCLSYVRNAFIESTPLWADDGMRLAISGPMLPPFLQNDGILGNWNCRGPVMAQDEADIGTIYLSSITSW